MKFIPRSERKIGDVIWLVKGNNAGCGLLNGDLVEIKSGIGKLADIYYTGGSSVIIGNEVYRNLKKVKLIKKI